MSARAIFFDPESAEIAARRLVAAGYSSQVLRERLAGEDDEEDQPWAVLSDAPEFVLDLLVEEFDGWLDFDDDRNPSAPAAPPLVLPMAPKRIKRPELLADGGAATQPKSDQPDTLAP